MTIREAASAVPPMPSRMGYSICIGGETFHHPPPAMFISEDSSRTDLEAAIFSENSLYSSLDEERFMGGGYSTEELYKAVMTWIEQGDECAASF